jgi:DnaJ-class molecular chaperone
MNPWKILGVHRKSSDAEIRDAYYGLAKEYHCDWHGSQWTAEFINANKAYKAIQTAQARRKFLDKVIGKDCGTCKGTGTISKATSLTTKTHTACKDCGGAGLIIREKNDERTIELRGTDGVGGKRRHKKH